MADLPPPPSSPPWPHTRSFRIEYADVDLLNHLNHAAYFRFMETLRCDYYLRLLGSLDPRHFDIIIAEAACRYLAPVAFDTELRGEVAPAGPLGQTSFTLLYRFHDTALDRLTARGRTVVVTYDYGTGAKKPIEPRIRETLERDAVDPAGEGW